MAMAGTYTRNIALWPSKGVMAERAAKIAMIAMPDRM
jgi:hypothetical protein